jgi:hypothetical protein
MKQYLGYLGMDGEWLRVLGRVTSLISTNISRLISWYTLIVPEVEAITREGMLSMRMGQLGLGGSGLLAQIYSV